MLRHMDSQSWFLLLPIQTSLYCNYSNGNVCMWLAFRNFGYEQELAIQPVSFLSMYLLKHWVLSCVHFYQQFMLSLVPTIANLALKRQDLTEILSNSWLTLQYQMMIATWWITWRRLRSTWCSFGRGALTVRLWISWDYDCTTKQRLVWPSMSYHQPADVPKGICSERTPICKIIALIIYCLDNIQTDLDRRSILKLLTTCWCQQH